MRDPPKLFTNSYNISRVTENVSLSRTFSKLKSIFEKPACKSKHYPHQKNPQKTKGSEINTVLRASDSYHPLDCLEIFRLTPVS